jgi:uncharacterized membrane protein YkvA (DUF1232 family)
VFITVHEEQIGEKAVKAFECEAKEYIENKDKAASLLGKTILKANENKGSIGKSWEKLNVLISIFNDWINNKYTDISTSSIFLIIIAMLYFVSTVDFIPDANGVGYVDDALVILFVYNQIRDDIDKYRNFQKDSPHYHS